MLKCTRQDQHINAEHKDDVSSNQDEGGELPAIEPIPVAQKKRICGTRTERPKNEFEQKGSFFKLLVYLHWTCILLLAYVREILRRWGLEVDYANKERKEQRDFTPLYSDFESLFERYIFMTVRDLYERPIVTAPGPTVNLLDRTSDDHNWTFKYTGTQTNVINVVSYNYLGFANSSGPCAEAAMAKIEEQGLALCTTVHERGKSSTQRRLEKLIAEFFGVDDAIAFSMGFATNSMNVPCLVDRHSLIVSDQHNHASLVLGCRLSGAMIEVFKHNDMESLEKTIRDAITYGNPKTHQPYKKILIVVEGMYSMEGSICNLPAIIALKRKYKAYLYIDEAHSVGSLGSTGRGVVEYWGCNPNDVDIRMGTFTKSFGASGGFIAGTKEVIDHLRVNSPTGLYSSPMSPPVAQQVITSMSIIMGKEGTDDGVRRIKQLARNARYFRLRLKQMGFIVYGSDDSPIVPVMLYHPEYGVYGREMFARGVGIVVISFPAVRMTEIRCRFCLSAAHTKEMLDKVLDAISEVGDLTGTKLSSRRHLYKNVKIKW
ncbi:unnamed protein product [Cylicocyclus nassatus]|uniref:serine C-palmitoyltransferase n=1 Tax=Cylicocyclus nassatus TaxID=53992 RepID=A0AA36GFS1_CYLNA|nr:unnamed protein product [Cylicocyclus nassatus]